MEYVRTTGKSRREEERARRVRDIPKTIKATIDPTGRILLTPRRVRREAAREAARAERKAKGEK